MRRFLLMVLTLSAAGLYPTDTARASCLVPPPIGRAIATADTVFLGTVTALENSGRWASVEVEEVWVGPEMPAEVEVRAGPKDPPGGGGVASSVDRYFKAGQRYLFFPFEGDGELYKDNACTNTTVFKDRLGRFRPASVQEPSPSEPSGSAGETAPPEVKTVPEEGGGNSDRWVGVALAVFALAVAAYMFRRRKSGAGRFRPS